MWLAVRQGESWYWTVPPTQIGGTGDPNPLDYEVLDIGADWGVSGPGPEAPDLAATPFAVGLFSAASCGDAGGCGETVSVTGAIDDWRVTIQR